MTDRERSLVTWCVRIIDETTKEMAARDATQAEPFMRLQMMAYEAIDRPDAAKLQRYREGRFN